MPSTRSNRALDAAGFFVADAQTGFGPFIAVYLATHGWSQGDIGSVLGLGTLAALVSQIPGGAAVDRLRDKRFASAVAALVVAVAALLFAVAPTRPAVVAAEVLHSFASAMLGPALAAISLDVAGRAGFGERLGRNDRFAALGNGLAAAVLGAAGAWISSRSVFFLTAGFMLPGIVALAAIRRADMTAGGVAPPAAQAPGGWLAGLHDLKALAGDRRVLGAAAAFALFHLANAALLPLASGLLGRQVGAQANLFVGACVLGPQAIVALLSPWVGRAERRRGVRALMTLGFAAVPLRAALLALAIGLGPAAPYAIVAVQLLDGISAASFGIALPSVAADLTRGSNRFNLCIGVFGVAITLGATAGNLLAGQVDDRFGAPAAFLMLALFGLGAVAVGWLATNPGPAATPA